MATDIESFEKISWRDPDGFVVKKDGRVFRAVALHKVKDVQDLLSSAWYQDGYKAGWFPLAEWVEDHPYLGKIKEFKWLEHGLIEFPCYPHEITALQLYDAAKLTLQIARKALDFGWTIKDASAWNVLFAFGKPKFCDILSFERMDDSGIWVAYAQFCRQFIIPLLLYKHNGIQVSSLFMLNREGAEPAFAKRMLSGFKRFTQPALESVTLANFFAGFKAAGHQNQASLSDKKKSPELARFLLARTLRRMEKHIDSVKPLTLKNPTKWENYEVERKHYTDQDISEKIDFVKSSMQRMAITSVLDLGCNAGEFSKIAAQSGKKVCAADYDHGALSRFYEQLRETDARISPVLLNIGNPTPSIGWMNREVDSFMLRACGKFDCVMALGLIHHLLVSERASLPMILDFFLSLDAHFLLLEWIEEKDVRFRQIAGCNQKLYADISATSFEKIFSEKYEIQSRKTLPSGSRTLYFMERKKTEHR